MAIKRTGWAIALMIFTLNSASEKLIIDICPFTAMHCWRLCQLTNMLSSKIADRSGKAKIPLDKNTPHGYIYPGGIFNESRIAKKDHQPLSKDRGAAPRPAKSWWRARRPASTS